MKQLLTFVLLLQSGIIMAQSFEWAYSYGSFGGNSGLSIAVDASGNVYSTGLFTGTADFDPSPSTMNLTAVGSNDIFVQKMSPSGNLIWAKSFGGSSSDVSYSIAVDAGGNVYTTGYFYSTVDFDPGVGVTTLSSVGLLDVFIQKLDPTGNFVWAKSFGGTGTDSGISIDVDASGSVYVIGRFDGTVDFDPGAGVANYTSAGGADIFIQKLDPSGNFLWAQTYGDATLDIGISIAVDAGGFIYTSGRFEGTVDFDPGLGTVALTSAGSADVFVQKLDATGNLLWAKAFGGTAVESGVSTNLDALGNVYVSGYFQDTVDFDPGVGVINVASAGGYDAFVLKLDVAGDYVWAKTFGDSADDFAYANDVDAAGNVYITGRFNGTVDFDPGAGTVNLTSEGLDDIFIQKLDASGDFQWVRTMGGILNDEGKSIAVDASNNVYTTGRFMDVIDFDPGIGIANQSASGDTDIFIHKLGVCTDTSGTDTRTECSPFTWIDGNTYTANNNSATHNIVAGAANGCDSIVTLDLTILNSTTGIDIRTECDSYTWIDGNTYTTDNDTATFIIAGGAANGCDSIVTLDLTINSVSDITTATSGITISANNGSAIYQWLDCDSNYSIVNGETNQNFTPSANGNYAVQLTENGCTDTSACVNISNVSLLENAFNDTFVLYPNPTKGSFSIDFETVQAAIEVRIMDARGHLIEATSYNNVKIIPVLMELASGVYLIEISDMHDGQSIVRLIIE